MADFPQLSASDEAHRRVDDEPTEEQQPGEVHSSWWASSEPSPDDPPPRSQSAALSGPSEQSDPGSAPTTPQPGADDPPPDTPADQSDIPTVPFSALTAEQAATVLIPPSEAAPAPSEPPTALEQAGDATRQLEASSAPALSRHISAQGLAAMAARDLGRVREQNQDSVFALLTTLPREGGEVPVGLFVVADGMGGHQGGEVASRLAVRTVVHQVLSQLVLPALDGHMDEALQPMMISAVQAANEAIWDSAQIMGTDMGTTCTAALLVGGSLYVAHVGDSRAYLYEPGGLKQLTVDHSTVGRLIQLGQLDPSEAREHPLRSQLYRTIGQQPHVMVDFIYQPVGESSHLLLCSDGLWGMVEEPLMEQALGRSPWPQDVCDELIALANLAGGDDNISAVVVTLPRGER